MEVAREMQVDLIHRQHLGIATAAGTPLHAEARPQGRFAQGQHGILAQALHAQGQSDAHRGLADARLGGRDGRHEDELVLAYLLLVNEAFGHLGNVSAVVLQLFLGNAQ